MMRSARRGTAREEGITLVLVALTLVVMMAFAALVVDIGGVYSMRRDDQNAADVASLAALHELSPPVDESEMFATVKQQAHEALGHTLTDAQWNSCPTAADDPGALAKQIQFANCISYNSVRVRVRIPEQVWETTFGAVIGRDEIRHAAFAIAGLEKEGFGGVLPFAVTGSGLGCLKTNSNGQASALCGSTTGNFGFLNFSHFGPVLGDPALNTTQSCGSGATQARIEANIAMGVDHRLSELGTVHVNPVADAPEACTAGIEEPDAAFSQTGNLSNQVTNGMFFRSGADPNFSDGEPARLQREDNRIFSGNGSRINDVATVDNLDDNALWRFIPPNTGPGEATTADFPRSCKRDQFVDASDNYYTDITQNDDLDEDVADFLEDVGSTRDQIFALLTRCVVHYSGQPWDGTPVGSLQTTVGNNELPSGCGADNVCTSPVFSVDTDAAEDPNIYDIQYTSRFGYVPEITGPPPGQSTEVGFLRFRAIFIQRLVIEETGTKHFFDPGFGPDYSGFTSNSDVDATGYQRVDEVLAFVFPDNMLPNGLADEQAPFELGVNHFPELIR